MCMLDIFQNMIMIIRYILISISRNVIVPEKDTNYIEVIYKKMISVKALEKHLRSNVTPAWQ